jgi:hypothetical protein
MQRFAYAVIALILAPVLTGAGVAPAPETVEGAKSFIARPQVGAAVFELPSAVRWRATPMPDGRYRIHLTADVNATTVLANVAQLSARALNRDIACDNAVKVKSAAAKLTSARALTYDVRFHYAKRFCIGMPLEYAAEVACSARVDVSANRSIITVDVQGAKIPPCRIEGLASGINDSIYGLVGTDVFKRHAIDVARLLPKEFQGVTVDIRTLAIDPATAVLHVAGDGTMSPPQFAALMTRLEAARFVRY